MANQQQINRLLKSKKNDVFFETKVLRHGISLIMNIEVGLIISPFWANRPHNGFED